MPSKFDENDKELVSEIKDELCKRYNANVHATDGVATFGGIKEDEIFPQAFITKTDIKHGTGRQVVRDSVLEKLKEQLENEGLIAEIQNSKIKVEIPQIKNQQTNFDSFGELKRANNKTAEDYQNSRSDYDNEEDFQNDDPFKDPY